MKLILWIVLTLMQSQEYGPLDDYLAYMPMGYYRILAYYDVDYLRDNEAAQKQKEMSEPIAKAHDDASWPEELKKHALASVSAEFIRFADEPVSAQKKSGYPSRDDMLSRSISIVRHDGFPDGLEPFVKNNILTPLERRNNTQIYKLRLKTRSGGRIERVTAIAGDMMLIAHSPEIIARMLDAAEAKTPSLLDGYEPLLMTTDYMPEQCHFLSIYFNHETLRAQFDKRKLGAEGDVGKYSEWEEKNLAINPIVDISYSLFFDNQLSIGIMIYRSEEEAESSFERRKDPARGNSEAAQAYFRELRKRPDYLTLEDNVVITRVEYDDKLNELNEVWLKETARGIDEFYKSGKKMPEIKK